MKELSGYCSFKLLVAREGKDQVVIFLHLGCYPSLRQVTLEASLYCWLALTCGGRCRAGREVVGRCVVFSRGAATLLAAYLGLGLHISQQLRAVYLDC